MMAAGSEFDYEDPDNYQIYDEKVATEEEICNDFEPKTN